jgi:hypoxanthine phosphoribosyltransferase
MTTVTNPAFSDVLIQPDALSKRVAELGEMISRDYAGMNPLLVGVLKGAVFFMSDVARHVTVPCEIDFMAVSSYGAATTSSGVVRLLKDLDTPIEGRHVIIVEDIIDSGLTLDYLLDMLRSRKPASIEVCALLVKPEKAQAEIDCRYVGFEIPNRFVVGYGLDYAERYRNLDFIAVLDENNLPPLEPDTTPRVIAG